MDSASFSRSHAWRWWVCGLLLLATMINYMDRLTLSLLAKNILQDLRLTERDYASVEAAFAIAFAIGGLFFGFLVDRWNVYWIYPLGLLGWSVAGFATGFAGGLLGLLLFRFLLGLMEASHWPCALRTTQHILPPGERSMGNSILQSGAALGAIVIPFVMLALFREEQPETWRRPFFVVGAVGALWVIAWMTLLRPVDLVASPSEGELPHAQIPPLPRSLWIRRLAVLVVLVITINMTWHFLRAWGPLFLQKIHGFTARQLFVFSIAYYACTDVGALTAGFLTLRLTRGGLGVHFSRVLVYFAFALLTALCLLVPWLPGGAILVGMLLVIGFGALGVFPNYYSFSQDLTVRHQGKLTGILTSACWVPQAIWQWLIGEMVESTGSYSLPFVISGLAPLLGFVVLLLFWGKNPPEQAPS